MWDPYENAARTPPPINPPLPADLETIDPPSHSQSPEASLDIDPITPTTAYPHGTTPTRRSRKSASHDESGGDAHKEVASSDSDTETTTATTTMSTDLTEHNRRRVRRIIRRLQIQKQKQGQIRHPSSSATANVPCNTVITTPPTTRSISEHNYDGAPPSYYSIGNSGNSNSPQYLMAVVPQVLSSSSGALLSPPSLSSAISSGSISPGYANTAFPVTHSMSPFLDHITPSPQINLSSYGTGMSASPHPRILSPSPSPRTSPVLSPLPVSTVPTVTSSGGFLFPTAGVSPFTSPVVSPMPSPTLPPPIQAPWAPIPGVFPGYHVCESPEVTPVRSPSPPMSRDMSVRVNKVNHGLATFPESSIPRLCTHLLLAWNAICVIPPTISLLTNLQELNLHGNNIRVIPREIKYLVSLKNLSVCRNKLRELPVELFSLVNLTNLNVSFNHLRHVPQDFRNLTNLRSLELHNNGKFTLPVIALGSLSRIKELVVPRSLIPEEFATFRSYYEHVVKTQVFVLLLVGWHKREFLSGVPLDIVHFILEFVLGHCFPTLH
ncbi:hypothetical protein Pelo_3135 [Pelomyxa schiedti]|nr:hypothetical protein Pelo_3135 [Pelomyxa schiedti]